jgi:NitT/TauT family transport system substrate-binding protein
MGRIPGVEVQVPKTVRRGFLQGWGLLLLLPLLGTLVVACGDDEGDAEDGAADEGAACEEDSGNGGDGGDGSGESGEEDSSDGAGEEGASGQPDVMGFAGPRRSPPAVRQDGGDPIRLGYSAWPGWFVWAVTEEAGIFEDVGIEVELEFFTNYIDSIDAMAAGELDANSQTLNDTLVPVSTGVDERVVIVNDNSNGNDAIIADQSIQSIEDLEGKTVAAEQGVVDHFLLLQGLDSVGMTEEDVDFRGVLTDAAAAGFAEGEFDAVGVFAPFTTQALERPCSHVLFDSSDFPGTIPDHLVVSGDLVEERPEDVQLLVDAWYATLDYIEENPDEAQEIMAGVAEVPPEEYAEFEEGTRIFSAEEALEAFEADEAPTGLQPMAEQMNEFLVDSGLAQEPAPLDDLFEPQFTEDYVERNGGG